MMELVLELASPMELVLELALQLALEIHQMICIDQVNSTTNILMLRHTYSQYTSNTSSSYMVRHTYQLSTNNLHLCSQIPLHNHSILKKNMSLMLLRLELASLEILMLELELPFASCSDPEWHSTHILLFLHTYSPYTTNTLSSYMVGHTDLLLLSTHNLHLCSQIPQIHNHSNLKKNNHPHLMLLSPKERW